MQQPAVLLITPVGVYWFSRETRHGGATPVSASGQNTLQWRTRIPSAHTWSGSPATRQPYAPDSPISKVYTPARRPWPGLLAIHGFT